MVKRPEYAAVVAAAYDLSHAAPAHWQAFAAAFDAYAKHTCVEAVQAPLDHALVAKGHAQGHMTLAALLNDLEARYRALQNKQR